MSELDRDIASEELGNLAKRFISAFETLLSKLETAASKDKTVANLQDIRVHRAVEGFWDETSNLVDDLEEILVRRHQWVFPLAHETEIPAMIWNDFIQPAQPAFDEKLERCKKLKAHYGNDKLLSMEEKDELTDILCVSLSELKSTFEIRLAEK